MHSGKSILETCSDKHRHTGLVECNEIQAVLLTHELGHIKMQSHHFNSNGDVGYGCQERLVN